MIQINSKLFLFLFFLINIFHLISISSPSIHLLDSKNFPYFDKKSEFKSYCGYLSFENSNTEEKGTNGHTFYWFFENENKNAPIVIWLNGGPGCCSTIAALMENGPLNLKDRETIVGNPFGWNSVSHVLYLDNPLNVGYSYSDKPNYLVGSATEAAEDIEKALKVFFETKAENIADFSEFKNNDVYIFGESYGGKYVLSLAEILLKNEDFKVNLKGVGLGNAWIYPDLQEKVYGDLAYTVGLTNYRNLVSMNMKESKCHELIEKDKYFDAEQKECLPLWIKAIRSGGGFNPYDYRKFGSYQILTEVSEFIKRDTAVNYFKVNRNKLHKSEVFMCADDVFQEFTKKDFQKNYSNKIIYLLNKIKVLIYNGQFDIRCSVRGTNELLNYLNWEGRKTFNSLKAKPFSIHNVTKGIAKTYQNLTQVVIYNAGHLSPHDQGEATLVMLKNFITDSSMCSPHCNKPFCPNECSGEFRGVCNTKTGKCVCDKKSRGDDCSTSEGKLVFGTETVIKGKIFGKQENIYNFFIGERGIGNFDIEMMVEKKSNLGTIHIYLHGDTKYIEHPDLSDFDKLSKLYFYSNTEDLDKRVLKINDIPRHNTSHISLLILNTVDSPTEYRITFSTKVSGGVFDSQTVALLVLLGILVSVALFLLGISLVQKFYDKFRY